MGMTSGRFVQVITGSEAVQGRFVVVWRRDSAGEWRALTETRIPDPPRSSRRR
jgi:ketosteroid isomerase-like protein